MYAEIIARHKPKGWEIVETRSKTKVLAENEALWSDRRRKNNNAKSRDAAAAEPVSKRIYCPRVECPASLFVLLHEFGHANLKHWGKGQSSLHREEFEAERYAAHIMRIEGIPIPSWVQRWGKCYIRRCIQADSVAGKKIHPAARRYAYQ